MTPVNRPVDWLQERAKKKLIEDLHFTGRRRLAAVLAPDVTALDRSRLAGPAALGQVAAHEHQHAGRDDSEVGEELSGDVAAGRDGGRDARPRGRHGHERRRACRAVGHCCDVRPLL